MALAFSYSLLDTFHNVCKKQAYHKFILRDVKSTYVQQDGIDAHKVIEARLRDKTGLPESLARAEPLVASLEKPGLKVALEIKLGLSHKLQACGFFDPDVRYRGVPDVIAYRDDNPTFLMIDWKTGKPRQNELQHKINAVLVFAHYPRAERITGFNAYTKTGALGDIHTFSRLYVPEYLAALEALSRDVELETQWTAREGPLCGWCPVKACQHNRSGA
jgi:hypothetical protein